MAQDGDSKKIPSTSCRLCVHTTVLKYTSFSASAFVLKLHASAKITWSCRPSHASLSPPISQRSTSSYTSSTKSQSNSSPRCHEILFQATYFYAPENDLRDPPDMRTVCFQRSVRYICHQQGKSLESTKFRTTLTACGEMTQNWQHITDHL